MKHLLLLMVLAFLLCGTLAAQPVRIVEPVPGQPVLIDSTVTIRWEGADGIAAQVWYSTDGRKTWTLLASNIRTGVYRWTVPDLPADSIAFRVEALSGASPVPLRTFPGAHDGEIRTASFSGDGRYLLSAGKDGFARVRDLRTDELDSAALPNGGELYAARFAATTDTVFVGQANDLYLWDRVRGSIAPMQIGQPGRERSFRTLDVYSKRGLLATAGGDNTICVWDYRTGALLRSMTMGLPLAYTIAFAHDGTRLAFAGDDGAVYEWAWETAPVPQVYRQHGAGSLNLVVWSCGYAPGDTLLASGGVDGTARVWRTAVDTAVQRFDYRSHVRSVVWSPDARRVLAGSLDSTLRQWDVQFGVQIGEALRHGGQVIAVDYSPTGDTLLSAGRDGAIVLWKNDMSAERRDTAAFALGRECVLEVPHLTGEVGQGMYVPLLWRGRRDIPEFMTSEGTAVVELPALLLDVVPGGNTVEHRRGATRDTVLLPVRAGVPGDTIAVVPARVLLGVPVRQEIRILSVHWAPGVRLVPTTVDGSITVRDTCGLLTLRAVGFVDGTGILAVTPTPATDVVRMTVALALDGQPQMKVYNSRGGEVATVEHLPSQAGVHEVECSVRHLPAGDYFVRLHTGGRQYSARLTIVR